MHISYGRIIRLIIHISINERVEHTLLQSFTISKTQHGRLHFILPDLFSSLWFPKSFPLPTNKGEQNNTFFGDNYQLVQFAKSVRKNPKGVDTFIFLNIPAFSFYIAIVIYYITLRCRE